MPDEVVVNVEGETPAPAPVVVAAPTAADPAELLRAALEANERVTRALAESNASNMLLIERISALEARINETQQTAQAAEAVAAAAADLAVQAATEAEEEEEQEEEEQEEEELTETEVIPVVESTTEVAPESVVTETAPEVRSSRRRYFI